MPIEHSPNYIHENVISLNVSLVEFQVFRRSKYIIFVELDL